MNTSITALDNGSYSIASRTDSSITYTVEHNKESDTLSCDCKGFIYGGRCYHIRDVKEYITMNEEQKETNKESESIEKLKSLPDGEYEDENGVPVLVESDKLDMRIKRLFTISLEKYTEGLWIPRIELSQQERKRIVNELHKMEKIWIKSNRMLDTEIESMYDSDLFRYYKMMNDMVSGMGGE